MTKADFVWTVGYQGNTAIVNRRMKSSVTTLSPRELLEQGHLKPAVCAAIWDSRTDPAALDAFVADFVRTTGLSLGLEDIKRLVGVYAIPEGKLQTLAV